MIFLGNRILKSECENNFELFLERIKIDEKTKTCFFKKVSNDVLKTMEELDELLNSDKRKHREKEKKENEKEEKIEKIEKIEEEKIEENIFI